MTPTCATNRTPPQRPPTPTRHGPHSATDTNITVRQRPPLNHAGLNHGPASPLSRSGAGTLTPPESVFDSVKNAPGVAHLGGRRDSLLRRGAGLARDTANPPSPWPGP